MSESIDLKSWPTSEVLPLLLLDETTKKKILFTSEASASPDFSSFSDARISGVASASLLPRTAKESALQTERTRKTAEVFTPAQVCSRMNDFADEEWVESPESAWASSAPIRFLGEKDWKTYVDSTRLEITCGEAPFLVSRYDAATGNKIPLEARRGILDRKLRVVGENTQDESEWMEWAVRAFQSVYGYELQGDSLLIARINLLLTFTDYLEKRWKRTALRCELEKIAEIISWNLWQMDGLTASVPFETREKEEKQLEFDWMMDDVSATKKERERIPCRIMDWKNGKIVYFNAVSNAQKTRKKGKTMKFDFVIGNPPYQEEAKGENETFCRPLYHLFLEEGFKIGEKVEMIHPARFLFHAGATPKKWNRKMLNDSHFKILEYEQDSSKVFFCTDIKGGGSYFLLG